MVIYGGSSYSGNVFALKLFFSVWVALFAIHYFRFGQMELLKIFAFGIHIADVAHYPLPCIFPCQSIFIPLSDMMPTKPKNLPSGPSPADSGAAVQSRATLKNAFFGVELCAKVIGGLFVSKSPRQTVFEIYRKSAEKLSKEGKHTEAGHAYLKAAYFSKEGQALVMAKAAFSQFKAGPDGLFDKSDISFSEHEQKYNDEKISLRNGKPFRQFNLFERSQNTQDFSFEFIQAYYFDVLYNLKRADPNILEASIGVFHLHSSPHLRVYLEFIFRDTTPTFTLGEALASLKNIEAKKRPFSVYNFYSEISKARQIQNKPGLDAERIEATCAETDILFEEYKILYSLKEALDRLSLHAKNNMQ